MTTQRSQKNVEQFFSFGLTDNFLYGKWHVVEAAEPVLVKQDNGIKEQCLVSV